MADNDEPRGTPQPPTAPPSHPELGEPRFERRVWGVEVGGLPVWFGKWVEERRREELERLSRVLYSENGAETLPLSDYGIPSGGKEGVPGSGSSTAEPNRKMGATDSVADPALPSWLDRNYRALMIGAMGMELFLLGVLVVLEWVRR